jgi:frataxin-like iron-binding protein CyaY
MFPLTKVKHKKYNALKRIIPFLTAAILLAGCIKEDAWCPTMTVSFAMEDEFLEGDYDSRIENDVLLYIFNDDQLVMARNIPYSEIAGRAKYAIEKTPELAGNLRFAAWAVKAGEHQIGSDDSLTIHHPDRNPAYTIGSSWDTQLLSETRAAGSDNLYTPSDHERYLGTLEPLHPETMSREESHYDIVMTPAPGRIRVNIEDPQNYLGPDAHVVIEGGMSQMGLGNPMLGRTGRPGLGARADVLAQLEIDPAATRADDEGTSYTTNIFGVLPTLENSDLAVKIMNGDDLVETLWINSDNTGGNFRALNSGDLIEFSYRVNIPEFTIRIKDWTERIVIAEL